MGNMVKDDLEKGRFSLDTGREYTNRVHLELAESAEIESLVLAYRCDGELFELAERTAPAVAVIEGDGASNE